VPASLKKCETFQTNKGQLGENEEKIKKIIESHLEVKKSKGGKHLRYNKPLPEGSMPHDSAFSPASLIKTGVDSLFHTNLVKKFDEWKPKPVEPEKKEVVIKSRKNNNNEKKKDSFFPNRLHDNTTFSTSVANHIGNLKREFPSVFKY